MAWGYEKCFVIVEFVIIITVIVILTTVKIPASSGIVKTANEFAVPKVAYACSDGSLHFGTHGWRPHYFTYCKM